MKKILITLVLVFSCSVSSFAAEAENIRIALVDTGISTNAIPQSAILEGENYVFPGDSTEDLIGHGTAVASLIAGCEGAGVNGICPDAKLVPLVFYTRSSLGAEVGGSTADAARAIYNAIDEYGCRIINISFGTEKSDPALQLAVEYARQNDAIVVSCAGNSQKNNPEAVYYPGGYDSVLCVGSADEYGAIADFSQQNETVDLLAPGINLTVADLDGSVRLESGTSFSASIVSASAALIWMKNPGLSAAEVCDAVMECTDTVDGWRVLNLNSIASYVPQTEAAADFVLNPETAEDTETPKSENMTDTEEIAEIAETAGTEETEDKINAAKMPEVNENMLQFEDVSPDDYFYDAVNMAVERKITAGIDNTHFAPGNTTTRAQMVTFLWRAAGSPDAASSDRFSDVSVDSYCARAVAWAVENGITNGISDTAFDPDGNVTRAQAVTFLWRAAKSPDAANADRFSDVSADSYYAKAVAWAVENGITTGTSDTTFSPENPCLRAQAVTFMYR